MTTLEEIQARFERADKAQDAYLEGRSINTAMVRSVACTGDVPKLVAALRAVDATCVAFDAGMGLGPGRATEMSHHTKMIRTAIREALNG